MVLKVFKSLAEQTWSTYNFELHYL